MTMIAIIIMLHSKRWSLVGTLVTAAGRHTSATALFACCLENWGGTRSYLYFPKWSTAFVDVQHTNVSWQLEEQYELKWTEKTPADIFPSCLLLPVFLSLTFFPSCFCLLKVKYSLSGWNSPTLSPACCAGLSLCTLHTNVHISTEFSSWWWRP